MGNIIFQKIKVFKFNLRIIYVVFILLVFSNLTFLINFNLTPNLYEPQENDTAQFPYVDTACKFSKYELVYKINKTDEVFNTSTNIIFYSYPSSIQCHGRPVISNANFLKPSTEVVNKISVGIGVNTLLDGIENVSKFSLMYILILSIFSKFKIKCLKVKTPDVLSFSIFLLISTIYGILVYPTIYEAIYNIVFALVFGNLIIFIIYHNFDISDNLKSLVSLSIIPLLFSDTNISFFWLFLLVSINLYQKKRYMLNRYLFFIFFCISFSTIANLTNFQYSKHQGWADWILFTNHRHKGGIADYKNGFQSLVFVLDIVILIFIFYSIFYSFYKLKNTRFKEGFSNSIILGFIIWFGSYFISQINSNVNYLVTKFLGLPEDIDTISSIQPDGVNWRGITPSWELTGLWLLVVFCILTHKIIVQKKYIFLSVLILNLIAISFNTQRTVLILMVVFVTFEIINNLKNKIDIRAIALFLFMLVLIFQGPAGERLGSRLQSINFNYEISEALRWEIAQSLKRYDEYDLNLPSPDYSFYEIDSYTTFFKKELGTENKLIINTFNVFTKVFGREFQWFRFFYLTDITTDDIVFGKGAGQSHQELAVLIETPHSAYFTILFQFGIFGLVLFLSLFFFLIVRFFKSGFQYEYLLGIFIFIANLKTEFLMTHNQLVFFIMIMTFLLFESKRELDRQKTLEQY